MVLMLIFLSNIYFIMKVEFLLTELLGMLFLFTMTLWLLLLFLVFSTVVHNVDAGLSFIILDCL